MPRSLPPKPSVRFLQKEAKDLIKAHKSGDASCCPTLRYHFKFSRSADDEILGAEVSLQEVQHALALDYGFRSWKELKDAVESSEGAHVKDTGDKDAADKFMSILRMAVAQDASDVHFEPGENDMRLRYRIDGVLYEHEPLDIALGKAVITEGMRRGQLDLKQRDLPQDGRVVLDVDGGRIDCRISTVPGARGTVLTARLIDTRKPVFRLDALAFEDDQLEQYKSLIKSSHGLIIVTGPTGAGKTTTLYSTLVELNEPSRKIMTIEDPVEYLIAGIDQLPVRRELGFESALRSVLRQAPNVILVGELRNRNVAELAIQASMTGHLVFSTLHAETAPGTYARLLNIGIEPFMINDTVRGVVAQRLVRKLCPECREQYEPAESEFVHLGIDSQACSTLWRAVGCENCNHTGYRGRAGVFSLVETNDAVKRAVEARSPGGVEDAAKAAGWASLREAAVKKLIRGETSVEEVLQFT